MTLAAACLRFPLAVFRHAIRQRSYVLISLACAIQFGVASGGNARSLKPPMKPKWTQLKSDLEYMPTSLKGEPRSTADRAKAFICQDTSSFSDAELAKTYSKDALSHIGALAQSWQWQRGRLETYIVIGFNSSNPVFLKPITSRLFANSDTRIILFEGTATRFYLRRTAQDIDLTCTTDVPIDLRDKSDRLALKILRAWRTKFGI